MQYLTQLLPIDDKDGFLLAIHHSPYAIGGEDTREVAYARLATGRAENPNETIDITAHGFPHRPACPRQARYLKKLARQQGKLARSGSYGISMSEHYAANERSMMHASQLARIDGVRVPRKVFTSRSGKVLMAFEPSSIQTSKECLPGMIRMLDLAGDNSIDEWKSSRAPLDCPGKGVERFSSVCLGRPMAFSSDGERVLLLRARDRGLPVVVECRLDERLSEVAQGETLHSSTICGYRDGWIALTEGFAQWLEPGLTPLTEIRLPRGSLEWGMTVTQDGRLLAVPANVGGDIFVLSREGGKARRFSPHRRVRRDDFARINLSECGSWMVSVCNQKAVLTRLADGVSWPVVDLHDESLQDASFDDYVVRSFVPATVGFVGPHLLTAERGALRRLPLAESAGTFVSEHGKPGARKPIRVKRSMDFNTLLRKARLERHSRALARLHSPVLQIKTKPLKKSGWRMPGGHGASVLGASRIGGWPDLPAGVGWPVWQDRPMAFLAQIDLAAAHLAQPGLRLPATGLLSFFLGCTSEPYTKEGDERHRLMMDIMVGTEARDGDAWRVLYHPEVDDLERLACSHDPLPELVEPCSLRFVARGRAFPDEHCVAYDQLLQGMSASEQEDYNELVGQLRLDDEFSSEQLMGYPQLIQSTPPELMCELAARGMNPWNYPELTSTDYSDLASGASNWTLLLQLTSNPHADFCWGDGGHFYFYGRRDAMALGDFSQVWVNFEN